MQSRWEHRCSTEAVLTSARPPRFALYRLGIIQVAATAEITKHLPCSVQRHHLEKVCSAIPQTLLPLSVQHCAAAARPALAASCCAALCFIRLPPCRWCGWCGRRATTCACRCAHASLKAQTRASTRLPPRRNAPPQPPPAGLDGAEHERAGWDPAASTVPGAISAHQVKPFQFPFATDWQCHHAPSTLPPPPSSTHLGGHLAQLGDVGVDLSLDQLLLGHAVSQRLQGNANAA
jgi:hypothetical protein